MLAMFGDVLLSYFKNLQSSIVLLLSISSNIAHMSGAGDDQRGADAAGADRDREQSAAVRQRRGPAVPRAVRRARRQDRVPVLQVDTHTHTADYCCILLNQNQVRSTTVIKRPAHCMTECWLILLLCK